MVLSTKDLLQLEEESTAVMFRLGLALLLIANVVFGDLYLHSPRGSNNRLNEKSANRNNGNRLFDSQVFCTFL